MVRRAESFGPGRCSWTTWVRFCCSRGYQAMYRRRKGRAGTVSLDADGSPEVASPDGDPTEAAERSEAIRRLNRALAELPEPDRELLAERYGFDGRRPATLREIARRRSVGIGTIGQHVDRAIGTVRELFTLVSPHHLERRERTCTMTQNHHGPHTPPQPAGDRDELLTLTEAGRELSCSRETVRMLCHTRKLAYLRISKQVFRIRRSDLETFMKTAFCEAGR